MYANDVTYTLKLYIYSFVCKLCNTYTYSSTYQLTLEDCWWFLLEVWCVKQIFSFFVSGVAVAETIDYYSTDIIYGIINNAAGNLNFVFLFSRSIQILDELNQFPWTSIRKICAEKNNKKHASRHQNSFDFFAREPMLYAWHSLITSNESIGFR